MFVDICAPSNFAFCLLEPTETSVFPGNSMVWINFRTLSTGLPISTLFLFTTFVTSKCISLPTNCNFTVISALMNSSSFLTFITYSAVVSSILRYWTSGVTNTPLIDILSNFWTWPVNVFPSNSYSLTRGNAVSMMAFNCSDCNVS